MSQVLKNKRHQMLLYAERMKGLSPLDKLSQGYSYTADEKGHKVTEVDQVREGDLLQIYVSDGQILAEVKGTKKADK